MRRSSATAEAAQARARETALPLLYVNHAGGQDELVFDGDSFVLQADGATMLRLPPFESRVAGSGWSKRGARWHPAKGETSRALDPVAAIYQALMTGLRDYIGKNGFKSVLV